MGHRKVDAHARSPGADFWSRPAIYQKIGLGPLVLLVAKLSDDFLVGGNLDDVDTFLKEQHNRYALGKIKDWSVHNFGGCEIRVDRIGKHKPVHALILEEN